MDELTSKSPYQTKDTLIMIKTTLLATFLMAFALIAIPTAQACGGGNCAKCAEAKAHYDKKAKKAPCAKCAEAKAHYKMTGEKKPCSKCAEAKAHYKEKATKAVTQNEKGSLVFKSGSPVKTGGTSSYND